MLEDLKHIQILLLKWLMHFGSRNHEQIRIACKNLCLANNVNEKHAILKLLYPLLKMGFIEFIGNGEYQITPPLIIFYAKQNLAVGINLSTYQKEKIRGCNFTEDIWGVIRFTTNKENVDNLCKAIECKYQKYDNKLLMQFPKIKKVIYTFGKSNLTSINLEYFDVHKHKWGNLKKEFGICRIGSESLVHYFNVDGNYFKIPSNTVNPEGRLLAESFQAFSEKENIFSYNLNTKVLTVHNLNLPILIERVLRLCSLHNSIVGNSNWVLNFPNITMQSIKQLNRIFDTKTMIIYG